MAIHVRDLKREFNIIKYNGFGLLIVKKMQPDVNNDPYLFTAQAICLLITHIFYYKSGANWQRIAAMAKGDFVIPCMKRKNKYDYFLVCLFIQSHRQMYGSNMYKPNMETKHVG